MIPVGDRVWLWGKSPADWIGFGPREGSRKPRLNIYLPRCQVFSPHQRCRYLDSRSNCCRSPPSKAKPESWSSNFSWSLAYTEWTACDGTKIWFFVARLPLPLHLPLCTLHRTMATCFRWADFPPQAHEERYSYVFWQAEPGLNSFDLQPQRAYLGLQFTLSAISGMSFSVWSQKLIISYDLSSRVDSQNYRSGLLLFWSLGLDIAPRKYVFASRLFFVC